jgi:pSer/pThr/pTyr-binding forkhead associated (FHA) protein
MMDNVMTQNSGPRHPETEEPRLVVLSRPWRGKVVSLSQQVTVLGRGEDADLQLAHPGISKRHCRVVREADGRYAIHDDCSTNFTFVNGKRVFCHTLSSGDVIQMSHVEILYEETPMTKTESSSYDANRIGADSETSAFADTINSLEPWLVADEQSSPLVQQLYIASVVALTGFCTLLAVYVTYLLLNGSGMS